MSGYGNTKIGTEWRGYYITAYGIAVKHGFQGTEEEWLKSLKGDGGEPIVIRYDETAQQLQDAEGDFTPSDFVRSVTGVDNVCERAARLGAEKLIVQKTARDGVTVAVAAEHWEVRFG